MKLRVIRDENRWYQVQMYIADQSRWAVVDRYWHESSAVGEMEKRLDREREYQRSLQVAAVIAEGEA